MKTSIPSAGNRQFTLAQRLSARLGLALLALTACLPQPASAQPISTRPPEVFTPDNSLPPPAGVYVSPAMWHAAFANGIIIRDKPATNIYLGRFFAESLMLAETGYINRSIQIAGTAEITQLPFFIAACDYTIIGEELFAVSAYLSREPRLLSSLKATDYFKALLILFILFGTVWMTYFHSDPARQAAFMDLFFPGS